MKHLYLIVNTNFNWIHVIDQIAQFWGKHLDRAIPVESACLIWSELDCKPVLQLDSIIWKSFVKYNISKKA